MLRQVFRSSCTLCSAVVAPKVVVDAKVNEGWERVKKIFETDDIGVISPELTSIWQTTSITGLLGGVYGGITHSKEAYLRFMERNQATSFVDHFEAKKKLQDTVTLSFMKGAMKWSWRVALFGFFYGSSVTIFSTYRGDASVLDFMAAGTLSGGLYRINYGLRGVIVGSTLGLMLGLFAGSMTTFILKVTDTKLEDVRHYQLEIDLFRKRNMNEATKKVMEENVQAEVKMAEAHDKRLLRNSSNVPVQSQ